MKNPLSPFLNTINNDHVVRWSIRLSLLVLVFCTSVILWRWQKLPSQIPLYYSLPWGEAQLASPIYLAGSLVGMFLLIIGNFALALIFFRNTSFYVRLMVVGSFIFSLLFSISLVQITLLVT